MRKPAITGNRPDCRETKKVKGPNGGEVLFWSDADQSIEHRPPIRETERREKTQHIAGSVTAQSTHNAIVDECGPVMDIREPDDPTRGSGRSVDRDNHAGPVRGDESLKIVSTRHSSRIKNIFYLAFRRHPAPQIIQQAPWHQKMTCLVNDRAKDDAHVITMPR